MTLKYIIYRGGNKLLVKCFHVYHWIATVIKFYGNGVKYSTFKTNGIPIINVGRKGINSIFIGRGFYMNNGLTSNCIGYNYPCCLQALDNAKLIIGDNVGMSQTTINAIGADVTIGNYTILGGGVKIYTTDYHSLDYRERRFPGTMDKCGRKCSPVMIGNDCFIGGGVTILKGVTIGDRAIIGACSVVTKDVPSDEIWAGNPAKFVSQLNRVN